MYGWRGKGEETGMEKVLDLCLEREKGNINKKKGKMDIGQMT